MSNIFKRVVELAKKDTVKQAALKRAECLSILYQHGFVPAKKAAK